MTLPGFNAETTLYKTSVHYRLTGAMVQADGIMPQLFSFCGNCYLNATGSCVKNCTFCEPFPPHCFTFAAPCNPSACQEPHCCPPGFHCCGDCLPGRCVPDPFSGQGCAPLGVRCR